MQTNFLAGRRWDMSIAERLDRMSIPEPMSGCTVWLGTRNRDGYGMVEHEGKTQSAHRVAWVSQHGPIPAGLEIDHRCKLRCCINTDHMRLATRRENTRNSGAVSALAAQRVACPQGHPYDGVNYRGARICRQCARAANERYEQRQRSGKAA